MPRVARLAQMAYHVIGMKIYEHACKEQQHSQQGVRFQQIGPTTGIQPFRSKIEQTACLHHSVQDVEHNAHSHNGYRHPALPFQQKRKDKRPLKVMQLKQQEEKIHWHRKANPAPAPQPKHDNENRRFHQHPCQLVVNGISP